MRHIHGTGGQISQGSVGRVWNYRRFRIIGDGKIGGISCQLSETRWVHPMERLGENGCWRGGLR